MIEKMASNHRYNFRIDDDLNDKLVHFAKKENLSINDFLIRSVEFYINYKLSDYDLAPLEVQRFNQLLSSNDALMALIKELINRVDETSNMTLDVIKAAITGMVGDDVVFNLSEGKGILNE